LEKQKEELTGKLGKLKPADAQAEKLRGELKDVEDKLRDARGYDAILAVQPSSLGPEDFESFIAVVEKGIPTAIFEDPFPAFAGNVPGTSMPRQAGGGGMMGMMMPRGGQPKGDINRLWTSLGVDFSNDQVVWQDYNPYQKATQFPAEFVFLDDGAKAQFNSGDAISKGLQHMLFPFPGSITGLHASELKFTPLVKTGARTGTVKANEILEQSPFGPRDLNPSRRRQFTARDYTLAAEIRGTVKAAKPMAAGMPPGFSFDEPPQPSKPLKPPGDRTINVVLVADLDMLTREFFRLREQGNIPEMGIHFDFDNVTFVLNALDRLTGDERFIELRSRRPKHRTLKQIDKRTEDAREDAIKAREEFVKEFEDAEKRAQEAMNKELEKLQNRKDVDPRTQMIELASVTIDLRRKMEAEVEQKKQERDRKLKKSDIDLNLEINRVRSWYKAWALLLPPILPLALAIVVFVIRRVRESEGVARSRLRG
jgi:ABC-2 type transport system permease protein